MVRRIIGVVDLIISGLTSLPSPKNRCKEGSGQRVIHLGEAQSPDTRDGRNRQTSGLPAKLEVFIRANQIGGNFPKRSGSFAEHQAPVLRLLKKVCYLSHQAWMYG
ncbi:MAG TPA: hypothetical protein PLX89_15850 [Verrucomicrobiota bacterium]|nr:hypothetical protein [Verrucomicrobiales bacterium]HRI14469.1 hypothetical protein [Verrucomicrobiota bacterium]